MIASLPMYYRPELAEAHDRYWALIRHELGAAGIESPASLTHADDEEQAWTDPTLVLSQTCGMPYRIRLHGEVTLVGTPDFGLDGCPPGYYRSAVAVRADDPRSSLPQFRDARFVFNHTESQSGYNAAFFHCAPHGFWFQDQLGSGSHRSSAQAVADGRGDIAALDAVSWRLIQRYEAFSAQLRVLEWTEPTPGLPYIAARGADGDATFGAVANAIAALTSADRDLLGIQDLIAIPADEYLGVPNYS